MKHFSATTKHHILLEYSPRSATNSFSALAARHGVKGGWRTIKSWFDQWDQTVESLQRKEGSGRPRIMNKQQVERHIAVPIRKANQSHKPISYPKVLEGIAQKTDLQPSLRTVQRYGEKDLDVRKT